MCWGTEKPVKVRLGTVCLGDRETREGKTGHCVFGGQRNP